MNTELLSITIPTRNRHHLLRDLLVSIAREIVGAKLTTDDVRVYISDNASEDDTPQVAHEILGKFPHFTYWRNPKNIGGDANIMLCARKAPGQYRWIIGDDEYLTEGALPYLIQHLRRDRPGWFIHSDGKYASALKPPSTYSNVKEFARAAFRMDPFLLITAGTISYNTFRADCFDNEFGESMLGNCSYCQFFSLMNGMLRKGDPVFVTGRPTIYIREERAAPPDPGLPLDSDANWKRCFLWIRDNLDLPELDPEFMSRRISDYWLVQLKQNPFKTFWNNRALFLIPAIYPRIVKRLWYAVKPKSRKN